MPHVNPTLPNDGESADAGDVSGPFLELLAVFNGHIGADNLEPGTIAAAVGNGDIDAAKLATGAVTTAKIADGAVTPVKAAPAVVVASSTSGSLTPVLTTTKYCVTDLAENCTVQVPTGTPFEGQTLTLRIQDNGTARSIAWNAIYRGINLTLPNSTVANKVMYISMMYNSDQSKWDVISVARQS